MEKAFVFGVAPALINGKWLYELIETDCTSLSQTFFPAGVCPQETRIVVLENSLYRDKDLKRRYEKMKEKDAKIVELKSEINDDYSDDSLFNISSWGADLSFRELISMYEDNELVKPELQRKYVWDKVEASRFIESILLGLPVPSIFLAQSGSEKLIVDGYQRIMTVYDYVRGIFSTDEKIFKLSNTEKINARWRNKAFAELSTDDQRKIKSTTIHAIIFEQKKPENDDTSLYQVFERINTSGRTLTPQEIRNCVYQGTFNSLLFELNNNPKWRSMYGSEKPDSRMRDIEFILRFFLMKSEIVLKSESKQIPLKKSLNSIMHIHQNELSDGIEKMQDDFNKTIDYVYNSLGFRAFNNFSRGVFTKNFHPAIYDSIMVAAFFAMEGGIEARPINEDTHKQLLSNEEYMTSISQRTTDIESIKTRIHLAGQLLFGAEI